MREVYVTLPGVLRIYTGFGLVWSGTLSFTEPVTSQVLLLLFSTVSVDASMTPDFIFFPLKLIQPWRELKTAAPGRTFLSKS